jgi:hypothetical protein
MRYHTPELLLVGAAQNLVLDFTSATSNQSSAPCYLDSPSQNLKSDIHELW